MILLQNTARNRMVFMTSSTDHLSGKAGLTLAISISKNGGAFASISPSVTERGYGWYSLTLSASHVDTLGDLAYHITGSGADDTDFVDEVVTQVPDTSGIPHAYIAGASLAGVKEFVTKWLTQVDLGEVEGLAATGRYMLRAFQRLCNKWAISGTTLSQKKSNDSDEAFSAALTVSSSHITGEDPS